MIKFALACERGHGFESWFPDGAAYDSQAKRGLIECPECDSRRIAKAPMAPAIVGAVEAGTRAPVALLDRKQREFRAALGAVRRAIESQTDDVGAKFPELARAIHAGDEPERAIRGKASLAEAKALIEEGVEVMPLPLLPDEAN